MRTGTGSSSYTGLTCDDVGSEPTLDRNLCVVVWVVAHYDAWLTLRRLEGRAGNDSTTHKRNRCCVLVRRSRRSPRSSTSPSLRSRSPFHAEESSSTPGSSG